MDSLADLAVVIVVATVAVAGYFAGMVALGRALGRVSRRYPEVHDGHE
jgi:hypothetical protein